MDLDKNSKASMGDAWFDGSATLNKDWIIQSPEGYFGRPAASLPKNLACKATDKDCDPQFLRHLCSNNVDCKPYNASCEALESSIFEEGQTAKKMCLGSGDKLLDRFYNVIVSSKQELDITTLSLPMNRFYDITVNALTRLALSDSKPSVRLLLSGVKTHSFNILNLPSGLLPKLIADMKMRVSKDKDGNPIADKAVVAKKQALVESLQIEMRYLSKPLSLSWNHAKIIIADQTRAIQGGHNFYDPDYLEDRPVFDASMEYSGDAVPKTTAFVNRLWGLSTLYAAQNGNHPEIGSRRIKTNGANSSGAVPVVGVGRLGSYGDNPSDRARIALIDNAKYTIDIAQEDIYSRIPVLEKVGFYKVTEPASLPNLIKAVFDRKVRLRIVQTDQESFEGYGMMGLAEGHARLVKAFLEEAQARNIIAPKGESLRYYVCTLFEHAPWRITRGQDRWPGDRNDELNRIGSHPKIIIVDGSSFYLGSHNFYPANLQEFGLIVSSVEKTKELQEQFWDKLWFAASVSKADCGSKTDEEVTYYDKAGKLQRL